MESLKKIISIITNLYNNSRCAVRTDGVMGDWFQIVTGVRQGCILSPLLFLLVMDWVLKRATYNCNCGIQWTNNGRLTDLDFADDIALVDDAWVGMRELTKRIETEAGTVGLCINAEKTKIMVVGDMAETESITAGGKQVEVVEEFCYLGSMISRKGDSERDIKTRIGKANAIFGRLNNIWKSKTLNTKIKIRLYESLVMSTLLYAAETWPMTVADMKKLEAAHHRWQRKILGVSWKDMVRNEEIRQRTGLERLEDILSKRRLRWFGHVQRMDDGRITKQALNWSPKDGRQKRGRPRKNWRKTLMEDLQKIEMDRGEAEDAAGDMMMWQRSRFTFKNCMDFRILKLCNDWLIIIILNQLKIALDSRVIGIVIKVNEQFTRLC